jgi:ATP-binding cassette subfamily F protein uup
MRNVCLKFGDDRIMLDDFSYDFCQGDRICLAGANGIGKTTFLKLITGELPPDSGEIELGETVVLGVYDQLGLKFDARTEQQTVLEYVVDQVQASTSYSEEATSPDEAQRLLKRFEFPRNRWSERVVVLSGGERRRLQLLSVLSLVRIDVYWTTNEEHYIYWLLSTYLLTYLLILDCYYKNPNFLLLDEPSVDCDLDTLSAVETFLQETFKGVLVVVSHDRSFADKVTDHLFVFEGNGVIKDFQGSLSEYASCLVELENQKIQTQMMIGGADANENNNKKTNDNYKEEKAKRNEVRNFVRNAKKEMNKLEKAMEKLKIQAETLQSEIDSSSEAGWTVLADLTDQLQKVNEAVEEKELTWLELAEGLEEAEVEP